MKSPEQATERIYTLPQQYAVHYRCGRRLRWPGGGTDYAALLLLEGSLRWRREGEEAGPTLSLEAGGALLSAPGESLSAAATGRVAYLSINLSPVFVLESAARARLTRADSFVTFLAPSIDVDERLARLARDLAEEVLGEAPGREVVVGALIE